MYMFNENKQFLLISRRAMMSWRTAQQSLRIIITFHISAFPQNLHIDFYSMRLLNGPRRWL